LEAKGMDTSSTNCHICGRPLSNFSSVKLGIGPVCKGRDSLQMPLPFENHADFDIITFNDQFVYLEDSGHTQCKTVTNDVKYVLSSLMNDYELTNQRIFYKDSDGQIDEVVHKEGVFLKFKHGSDKFSIDELNGKIVVTKKETKKKKTTEYEIER
jgi:hypothetical protein